MSSPMSVLSRTLQSISLSKIRELDSRRNSYEARKQAFINKAHGSPDPRDRLGSLLDGCRELASPNAPADHSLDNIERWLAQSKYDASIPESKLANFDRQLHSKLDVQSRRLDMAHLYSRLLTEWMEQAAPETSSHPVAESQRQRLKDLVDKFESVVFEPLETSEHEIRGFLDGLFPDEKSQETVQQLRDRVSNQTASLMNETCPFNQASLTSCIKGLLTEDLVSDEKRAILQNFLESEVAKDEIADVLNMRFADIKRWQWNAGELGIPVMPRAGLNGKYRIWADDDILQMIFVQYIGVKLSTIMKGLLKQFMEKVWTRDTDGHAFPSARDRDRRRYYLNQHWVEGQGVEPERTMNDLETFFLSSLPSTETSLFEGGQQYDNEMDETDDDDDDDDWAYSREVKLPKQKTNIRQQLLRQLTAEMFIHRLRGVTHQSPKDARGPVALIQTDIQWFGTSIPHSTAFAVMRYFGFQEEWIDFFRKYLEAPLNLDMASDDRPQHGARTRKRGVPMAHASEKLIGEMLLFCMDMAVHRQTGVLLYRIHDDIWLCGEPETAARAWACMQEYAKIFGLEFNRSKTGSVYLPGSNSTISPDAAEDDSQIMQRLPAGTVSVGFLVLDSPSGKWQIDQGRVSAHLVQLEKQLSECKSVLAWVQTWNSCIGRFFTNVLGEPAHCLGVEHVDAMLDTYSRMLKRLLPPPANGNVTAHVKSMISSHLDLSDESAIPDAFIHLPETLGGLGLRNPFVPLLLVRDQLSDPPDKILEKYLAEEYAEYLSYKKLFDESPSWKLRARLREIMPDDSSESESETRKFFSPLEFTKFRERFSNNLKYIYTDTLLSTPQGKGIALDKRTLDALDDALSSSSGKDGVHPPERSSHIRRGHYRGRGGRGGYSSRNGGIRRTSGSKNAPLTPENKWFVALYAEELLEAYGGLSLVDKQFLPGGVLSMMRQKKVTWQMML